jgi:hypothetical protein
MLQQAGYLRGQVNPGELAEGLSRERLAVQYELCKASAIMTVMGRLQFLLAAGSLEDKRGPQLLRNLIQLLQTQEV